MRGVSLSPVVLPEVRREAGVELRKARLEDVDAIYWLIRYWAEKGLMLVRSHSHLYENIRDFWVLEDEDGQIVEAHSIAAGLDYPGVGPEHAYLKTTGRAQYHAISDAEALEAFQLLCRTEGIIPALESAHAVALAVRLARERPRDQIIVVNLSGRGDKDMHTVASALGVTL